MHPERYTFIQTVDDFEKIKRSGVKMQLNALSLLGFYSKDSEKGLIILKKWDCMILYALTHIMLFN